MKKLLTLFIIIAISINANAQIVIDSTNIVPTCLDCDSIGVVPLPNSYGSLYIEVSGGVPPYTFSLTGDLPANLTPVNIVSSSGIANYTQLCQDTFQLAILDNGGASSFFYFSTIPPPPPTFNIDSVSVKADSTNNPDSGVIELHVTTNADSIFYKIQEQNNSFQLGTLGGWQDSTIFDSLPGGYSYKVFVDIYPKVLSCGGGLDTGTSVLLIYVPLACENDGFAGIIVPPSACVGDVVNIDGFSYPGSGINNFIVVENWDLGDGFNTSGPGPIPHVYTQANTYWINYMIMTSHGCTFYDMVPITINPLPIASYTSTDNGTGLFSFIDNSSGTISSWFWDFGDGNTSNAQNPNHQYAAPNTYSVCLTTTTINGCIDMVCGNVTVTAVGLNELTDKAYFSIYPNPAKDQITIRFNEVQSGRISVRDVTGREVMIRTLHQSNKVSVDIVQLSQGVYFLSFKNKVIKFVKE